MEFRLFGDVYLLLPPLHISAIILVIIYLLFRWSKQSNINGLKIFFYFLISTCIIPIYSHTSSKGLFELWIPIGFIFIFFYLYRRKGHSAKMKASLLGLTIAIYQIIQQYIGLIAIGN